MNEEREAMSGMKMRTRNLRSAARRLASFMMLVCVCFSFSPALADIVGFFTTQRISSRQLVHEGDVRVAITYGEDANIPSGTEISVTPVADEETYAALAAESLGTKEVRFLQLFDLSLMYEGQKLQPDSQVTVQISLPESIDQEVQILHFADPAETAVSEEPQSIPMGRSLKKSAKLMSTAPAAEVSSEEKSRASAGSSGVQVIAAEVSENTVSFETTGFSVYGIITNPRTEFADALNGRSASINVNGNYLMGQTVEVADNPVQIRKTSDPTQAAIWLFEASGTTGEYYVSTMVNGERKYMNITAYSDSVNSANLTITDTPQSLTVRKNGNNYYISSSFNGQTYYINHWKNGSAAGFACWYSQDNNTNLTFTFTSEQASIANVNHYAVIVKHEGNYYVVQNDGSLIPATYHAESNLVEMEYPLLWDYRSVHMDDAQPHPTWEPYNLRIATEATGFDGNSLPLGYYYRYINPDAANAISEESQTNTDLRWPCGLRYKTDTHRLVGIQWVATGGYFVEKSYIGAGMVDGKLHLTGNNNAAGAAEIYLAQVRAVAPPSGGTHDDHTVNHIDISVEGTSRIKIPLAYGDYYDSNGHVIYTATPENHFISMEKVVEITKEDIKRAEITAATKDENGISTVVQNAFYITGYSGNSEANASTAQVRIEGSFKVADLPVIANADTTQTVRDARKAHRIYYTVSTVKEIEFTLQHNGQTLYDAEGKPIIVPVPVTISASFDYWDEDNECPPVHWTDGNENKRWKNGEIIGNGSTMSGMDFKLGSKVSETEAKVPAIEITKYVQTSDGHPIKMTSSHVVEVNVFHSSTASSGEVVNKGTTGPVSAEELSQLLSNHGYRNLHQKKITVGRNGIGSIYDYDIRPGMIYIAEDDDSVEPFLVDEDGYLFQYIRTRTETEYAWRVDGDEGKVHHANGYSSMPDFVGDYQSNHQNMFLEFSIYNIYEQPKIKLIKTNAQSNSPLQNAEFGIFTDNNGAIGDELVLPDESESRRYTSDASGVIFEGALPTGTYWLQETHAPAGFISIRPVGLRVNADGTFDYKMPDGEWTRVQKGTGDDAAFFVLSIPNTPGVTLPSTGGEGTGTIYLLGAMLMISAGFLLIRRMGRRRE